jgi:iron complex transport system ATP-binding protein
MIARPEALALQNVGFAYGDVSAVNGLSLTLAPGAFVGVIGPNGSGKSTVVKLLSGYLRPRSGTVTLGSRPLAALTARERARQIAVVTQELPGGLDFTALEVVLMGRSPHLGALGVEDANDLAIAREAMRRTGTDLLADRPLGMLSGGERQRVLFARALAQQTSILLLDEPTAHLDVNYQMEMLRLLQGLHAEASTSVLTVLHDLNLAALYCDYLFLLKAGRLVVEGPPSEVLTAARIAEVYGVRLWCRTHAETGRPYVLPFVPGGHS